MPFGKHRSAWHWARASEPAATLPKAPSGDPFWFAMRVSTDEAGGGDPYDFWRNRVYYDFSADRRTTPATSFRARALLVASPRGEFVHSRSSDLSGARTRASLSRVESSNLTIGLILSGRRDHEDGDWRHRAEAGDLYLYDASRPSRLSMSDHRVVYLSLKGDVVDRVLGTNRPDRASLLQRLSQAPLRPFLQMQLRLLVENEKRPEPAGAGRLLDIAIDLALLMLQQTRDHPELDVDGLRPGLVAAAQHLIASRIDDPRLDAAAVATGLGISRATLYRAFAGQDLTIAGQIRMMRLIRARHLLEASTSQQTIGDLILGCGIEDAVHFARQFRSVFGIRPSEIKGIRLGDNPA